MIGCEDLEGTFRKHQKSPNNLLRGFPGCIAWSFQECPIGLFGDIKKSWMGSPKNIRKNGALLVIEGGWQHRRNDAAGVTLWWRPDTSFLSAKYFHIQQASRLFCYSLVRWLNPMSPDEPSKFFVNLEVFSAAPTMRRIMCVFIVTDNYYFYCLHMSPNPLITNRRKVEPIILFMRT